IKGLISGLDDVDWPESTKQIQKNWIGRSEGAAVKFSLKSEKFGLEKEIGIYTTRADTLFGCSYFVLSPEHPLVGEFRESVSNWSEVEKYRVKARKKTELERTDLAKKKTGVKLEGVLAVNPVNGGEIPVFIADYVLADYGTGAVMAVPAHDQRDWEFARKYKLSLVEVLKGGDVEKEAFVGDGPHINSSFLDGLNKEKATEKIVDWLEKKKLGGRTVNYKLRDWLVSRQRYWGAPIPIIYCEKCGAVPVPEKDLPVKLPRDVDFMPTGESPLKYAKKFQNVKCPKCGAAAKRESDTMDTFVCSSWYYLRYADPKNSKEFAGKKALKKWLPVDIYVGGAEHSVLHLLYARFFAKVLQKYGLVDFNEPFLKLRHQGTILAEDGTKMSKSKGNVVNPDKIVAEYGADILRLYEMFMGPLEDAKSWNTKGIMGVKRFLEKVWRRGNKIDNIKDNNLEKLLHKTIKKVTEDIEEFKFNTAISQMMIFANEAEKSGSVSLEVWKKFLLLLSPFAPHIAEELWERLKAASVKTMASRRSIFLEKWPSYDAKIIQEKNIKLIIQINGKMRDIIEVEAGISEKEIEKLALSREKIQKWTDGEKPKKVIYIPERLVNLVM
ncbi:leucine--tRNA ligase, partial [Patescibacteria group bacterium]|nr:leucine--tRNA ligase [Patescibacteria group bacterium]